MVFGFDCSPARSFGIRHSKITCTNPGWIRSTAATQSAFITRQLMIRIGCFFVKNMVRVISVSALLASTTRKSGSAFDGPGYAIVCECMDRTSIRLVAFHLLDPVPTMSVWRCGGMPHQRSTYCRNKRDGFSFSIASCYRHFASHVSNLHVRHILDTEHQQLVGDLLLPLE